MYRLITRGTLEEKIMGLQKFKMSIANTVISQENASLQSMGTDQLLNLFTLDKVRPRLPQLLFFQVYPCRYRGGAKQDKHASGALARLTDYHLTHVFNCPWAKLKHLFSIFATLS